MAPARARRSTDDICGKDFNVRNGENQSRGSSQSKLSEPMWTLFFELHTGPWRKSGHDKRPDTRPIDAPSRNVAEKITLQNRGHPHTPRV